ncbi:hypothetical protein POTOM_029167 [Populus tomentosa]|uniref:Uncharacterized protein n=1 Tax=Populus tomentosa TaxID=118781 RepID=A0A8X7Z8H1_POPTO|nr:hypothetical protein POTOM_029167 [Populus tomentosa]
MYGSAATFSLLDYTSELKIIVYLFQLVNIRSRIWIFSRFLTLCVIGSYLAFALSAFLKAGAYGLVLTFDTLTQRNIIQQSLSRKLVHIIPGSLFAACWRIFRGPLYYALTLILCALVFWRQSPPGVISMAMVCGGDDNVDYCEVPAGSRRQRAYCLCWPVIKKHFRETALIASWPNATSSISLSAHEEGGNKSIERAQSD